MGTHCLERENEEFFEKEILVYIMYIFSRGIESTQAKKIRPEKIF